MSTVMRCIIMACLTIAYVNIEKDENDLEGLALIIKVTLLYRALNKLYHCPLTAALESIILLFYPSLEILTLAAFALNRALIFYRKATYILVSFITAMKNKK